VRRDFREVGAMIRDFARALVIVLAFLFIAAEVQQADDRNAPEWSGR
jgi:hypothetical protein